MESELEMYKRTVFDLNQRLDDLMSRCSKRRQRIIELEAENVKLKEQLNVP